MGLLEQGVDVNVIRGWLGHVSLLDYFRRLGHDNHRRLSKLYAWEEKKSKTSWGAETVDYEKRVSGFVLANPELKSPRTPYKP